MTNKREKIMPKKGESLVEERDQQILRRLANIEHKIDSLEQTQAFALRADAERHFETVKKIFGASSRRAQVYIAANGQRSVQDIADVLRAVPPNVSRELARLKQEGLVEVVEQEGGKTYWGKKSIDRTVRISEHLKRVFHLDKNGLPIE